MVAEPQQTLFIDGCDDAIVGYVERCGQPLMVVYDIRKLVTSFCKQGMTYAEAEEWVSVNVTGAWMGTGTPGVLFSGTRRTIEDMLA